jgi:hypothetical protein
VKTRMISRVVAVMAAIALFATMAQAGSKGPTPFAAFFECHAIQSGNSGLVVNISANQFRPGEPDTVGGRIGNAVLVCTGVDVSVTNPDGSISVLEPVIGDHLKCYTIGTSGPRITPQDKNLLDGIVGSEDVRVSDSRVLCGTAIKTDTVPE